MRLLSDIKNLLAPAGFGPRTILSGAFRGIKINLSLQTQTQIYLGLFERETHPWLNKLSSDAATAIDVGAAFGEHTLFFLAKTNAAKVYAFEPDQNLTGGFAANMDLNGMKADSRLDLRNDLVGSKNAVGEITLDSLADGIARPCVIKLDVEGAEMHVLEGARRLNKLAGVRWIIETHSKPLEDSCIRTLSDAGFRTKIVANAWWRAFVPELRNTYSHNRWLVAWND